MPGTKAGALRARARWRRWALVALLASAASAVALEIVGPAVRGHPVVIVWIAALVLADLILLAGWQASSYGVWRELRKPDEPPYP